MKNKITTGWKYNFCLMKAYFDNGYSLLSYPKWILATVGIGGAIQGANLKWLLLGGFGFGLFCFAVGYVFLRMGFYKATQEVENQFNEFVIEVRKKIKSKNI